MRAYINSLTLEVWWWCKRKENHSVAATPLFHALPKEMVALKYISVLGWFFQGLAENIKSLTDSPSQA